MTDENIQGVKKNIVAIGRLLWERNLASGLNGNISARIDDKRILLTGIKTCLGLLQEKDILLMDISGNVLEEGHVSTEKLLHTSIYREFKDIQAVIHTHTTYANAYFLENKTFHPRIYESKIWFGDVEAIEQRSPSVTNANPVIEALHVNNVAALQNHGLVAMGKNLFDCFLLVQGLEEAIKVEVISRLCRPAASIKPETKKINKKQSPKRAKKYVLFSNDQIKEIVRLANSDALLKELGEKTKMTMDLAVKMNETGKAYRFKFTNGHIASWDEEDQAEFMISANEEVWRAVFNRQIDPFVATTQKKMHLNGDFGKISKWYEPCSRIFELWQQVPIK